MNNKEIEVLEEKKNNNYILLIIMIILFIINSINIGIYTNKSLKITTYQEWGEIAHNSIEEEKEYKIQKEKKKQEKDAAEQFLEKYENTEKDISYFCSVLSIIILIFALTSKKKIGIYFLLTILIIIESCILIM